MLLEGYTPYAHATFNVTFFVISLVAAKALTDEDHKRMEGADHET